jgi:hypothetical protein
VYRLACKLIYEQSPASQVQLIARRKKAEADPPGFVLPLLVRQREARAKNNRVEAAARKEKVQAKMAKTLAEFQS